MVFYLVREVELATEFFAVAKDLVWLVTGIGWMTLFCGDLFFGVRELLAFADFCIEPAFFISSASPYFAGIYR